MNYSLAQIILAARNRNLEDTGWMQILIAVVLAVFYAVGSIVKAKANMSRDQEQEEEQPSRKRGFRPVEGTPGRAKALPKIPYQQAQRPVGRIPRRQPCPQVPTRRKVMRPQSAVQKFAAKEEQTIRLQTIKPLEVSKLPQPKPQVQPDLKELAKLTSKPLKQLEDKDAGAPAETEQARYLPELLLDYGDPDELKKAILHYEILGKPLSLREPSQRIS